MSEHPPNDIEAEYNPRVTVAGFDAYFTEFERKSAQAAAELNWTEIRYGEGERAVFDLFQNPTSDLSPVLLFFHGGYWRGRDKSDFRFIVPPLLAEGMAVILANYDLCPSVEVGDIVTQAISVVDWLRRNGEARGLDAKRVVLAGHSAGAHLAAMICAHDWPDMPPCLGAVLISGIYELAPVIQTSLNEVIRLRPEQVAELSPQNKRMPSNIRYCVTVGGEESRSWIGQSRDFAALLRGGAAQCELIELPGCNHFDIVLGMDRVSDPNMQAIMTMVCIESS